jgi:hypothetical protein
MNAKALVLTLATVSGVARAQSTTQSITYTVSAINVISVTGAPSLTINSAVTGTGLTASTDATGTWSVTSNAGSAATESLHASLNSNMPAGVTLELLAAAPTHGTSAGYQALSTTGATVVSGINLSTSPTLSLTYRLSALLTAGAVALGSKTVTFTIVAGP